MSNDTRVKSDAGYGKGFSWDGATNLGALNPQPVCIPAEPAHLKNQRENTNAWLNSQKSGNGS